MEVTLTADQEALIRDAVSTGHIGHEEEAVRQAMLLWEERERRRLEIIHQIETAQASLARGEGRTVRTYEEGRQLVEDIRRRGMARLAAQNYRRP